MGILNILLRYLIFISGSWFIFQLIKRSLNIKQAKYYYSKSETQWNQKNNNEILDVMVQDSQCGVYIPKHEAIQVWIKDKQKKCYFCSKICKDTFLTY